MTRLSAPNVNPTPAPELFELRLRDVVTDLDRVHMHHSCLMATLSDPYPLSPESIRPEPSREIPYLATSLLPVIRCVREGQEPRMLYRPATLGNQAGTYSRPLDSATLTPARVAVGRPKLAR